MSPRDWVSNREARRRFDDRFDTRLAQNLVRHGFRNLEHVRRTADDDLLDLRNVGPTTLRAIRVVVGYPPPGADPEPPPTTEPPAWTVIA